MAILQGLRVILDVIASYVSLYILDWGLVGVGIGTILASCLVASTALTCILLLPPEEGRHKIAVLSPLVPAWLPALLPAWMGGRAFTKQGTHELGDLEGAQESLLPGPREDEGFEGEAEEENTVDGEGRTQVGGGYRKVDAEGLGVRVSGGGSEEEEEEERVNAVLNESTWKFVWDGLSTMLRSALVQASFFLVLACATVLGMYAVAAHQVSREYSLPCHPCVRSSCPTR